jgi:hypothetical protein
MDHPHWMLWCEGQIFVEFTIYLEKVTMCISKSKERVSHRDLEKFVIKC